MTYTIGVDPGISGAIALIDDRGVLVDVYDMPVVAGQVSPQLLGTLECWDGDQFGTVVIEAVHAMPGQGVSSMHKFGRAVGIVEGVLWRRPVEYVTPAVWKKALGLGKDKELSRRRAIELWPGHADKFARAKDDGRAEAALIALWYVTTRKEKAA